MALLEVVIVNSQDGGTEVRVGDEIPGWEMDRVTPERMKTVAAILRDPMPLHWDREVSRSLGFMGKLLNQSPINLGYVVNMLHAWAGPTCIRRVRTEFPNVVFDGDQVRAGGIVKSIERVGDEMIAECEVWLDRSDGTRSLEARAWIALQEGRAAQTKNEENVR